MKNLLPSLVILSATLFCHAGAAADLTQPASGTQVQQAAVRQAVPLNEALDLPPTPQLQLASIGDGRSMQTGNLRAASRATDRPAGNANIDRLPSTPTALACLVLVICILVGHRNADEHID